ncbi:hypothetical protein NP233_g11313 [Leucocoprinus birnbaumii]|uniref:Uncharacterized protein n=1 Tax=Leucocoprinus birnbaumii TaxID=56174 RepID=A0AAD5VIR2_9AGAR|nr:hypothetical protein NP233_g11313 [Leucocoprinus birnbaumii]
MPTASQLPLRTATVPAGTPAHEDIPRARGFKLADTFTKVMQLEDHPRVVEAVKTMIQESVDGWLDNAGDFPGLAENLRKGLPERFPTLFGNPHVGPYQERKRVGAALVYAKGRWYSSKSRDRNRRKTPRAAGRKEPSVRTRMETGNQGHRQVRQFLDSCTPKKMGFLLESFVEFGCHNRAYLETVANRSPAEIAAFLRAVVEHHPPAQVAGGGLSNMDVLTLQWHFGNYFS